jgi:hypothetical protein
VLPAVVTGPVAALSTAVQKVAPDRLAAVYLVGGTALGDFSARQSNFDVVVVSDPPLAPAEVVSLRRAERRLERAGRPAAIWHTGWQALADGPTGDPAGRHALETPLTRALLREEAIAVSGPDWPVVAFDEADYRHWCRAQLRHLAATAEGLMVMRKGVAPLVLQAARLAQGAATGRVFSKSEAGDTAVALVPLHFRRILADAVGYRHGANTSMYWGPFERKYDAQKLIGALVEAVTE